MKVGFQSVGDSDAMLGDDIYVLIDVPGWVDDCALPGLFRAYHIGIVGQTFDSGGFNEQRSSRPWLGFVSKKYRKSYGRKADFNVQSAGDNCLAGLVRDRRGDCLTGFGAGAVDRASVAEQGREYDSSQDDSGGYRLGLEN